MLRRLISKFIFVVGCCTLLAIVYIASFYAVKNKLIRPFERANIGETHALRPLYNGIYYPLRYYSANGSSFTRDIPDIDRGTLEKRPISDNNEKNYRSAGIDDFGDSYTSIGFVGHTNVIKAYDEIENGTFVKLTFGRALTKKHDRFINKLVDLEVIELMEDPRLEKIDYSKAEEKRIHQAYDDLDDDQKICSASFMNNYKYRVLKHCQQAGYAQNIGGGCYHIIGYSVHTAVFEQALKTCAK